MKTHVGPMIRLIQLRLNNCSPVIWSRKARLDGVEDPLDESTDQENVASLNPISSSRSISVGTSTIFDGLSANESSNSVLCRNSVIRSNETLPGEQKMRKRSMRLSRTYLESPC